MDSEDIVQPLTPEQQKAFNDEYVDISDSEFELILIMIPGFKCKRNFLQ